MTFKEFLKISETSISPVKSPQGEIRRIEKRLNVPASIKGISMSPSKPSGVIIPYRQQEIPSPKKLIS